MPRLYQSLVASAAAVGALFASGCTSLASHDAAQGSVHGSGQAAAAGPQGAMMAQQERCMAAMQAKPGAQMPMATAGKPGDAAAMNCPMMQKPGDAAAAAPAPAPGAEHIPDAPSPAPH